jgi:serine/threonine-protein kinase
VLAGPHNKGVAVLTEGTRLGPYQILSSLGAGGMGEVYRAHDTRLGRDVAVKVLPRTLAKDIERRARFEREARAVASLNHPYICSLYDVGRQRPHGGSRPGDEDEIDFLVMELVEGETLAARLSRRAARSAGSTGSGSGPSDGSGVGAHRDSTAADGARALPLEETLRIARQLAEALAAAHRAGIVHRDLKPGNVMVTKSGIKVLDFGLAKLRDPVLAEVGEPATATSPLTGAGVLMGTMPYMAPEQLEGRDVDARTDIFAFGAIVHEMGTGRRAFAGDSQASLIASILDRDPPPISALVPTAPPLLDRLVRRCIAKDPDARWQSASDLAAELQWIAEGVAPAATTAHRASARLAKRGMWYVAGAIAGIALATLGVVAGRWTAVAPSPPSAAPIHAVLKLPPGVRLSGWGSPVVALSPDGRVLAFVGVRDGMSQLYVQRIDRPAAATVAPNSNDAEGPFFSPDGAWVAFASGVSLSGGKGELKKYSLASGLTQPICDIPDFFGGLWREDGTILFYGANGAPVQKVAAAGGKPQPAVPALRQNGREVSVPAYWPQALPDGSLLVQSDAPDGTPVAANLDLKTGEMTPLAITGLFPKYTSTGHIVYLREDATLMAVPFDAARRVTTGPAVALLEDVSVTGNGEAALAVTEAGLMVYTKGPVAGSTRTSTQLVRVTKDVVTPLPVESAYFRARLALAPDGKRLAVSTWDGALWVYDLIRHTRMMLPGAVRYRAFPAWSRDGTRVAFVADVGDFPIYWQRADGVSNPELVWQGRGEKGYLSFSPDGQTLFFSGPGKAESASFKLWRLPLGTRVPQEISTNGLGAEVSASISPDNRWLLYASNETGRFEVFIQPYPAMNHKTQVSVGGGAAPQWSPDGRTIFYRKGTQLLSASVSGTDTPVIGAAQVVIDRADVRGLQPSPDGAFLGVQDRKDTGIVSELNLVVNWFGELKRLVPAAH